MFRRSLTALALSLVLASCARRPETPALEQDQAHVDGRLLPIAHSRWDIGQTSDMFDDDPATMARTAAANPAIIELRFPEPRPLSGIWLKMGGEDFRVTAKVKRVGSADAKTYTRDFPGSGLDPELELDFEGGGAPVESVRIELLALRSVDEHIHVRTLRLR